MKNKSNIIGIALVITLLLLMSIAEKHCNTPNKYNTSINK